VHDNFRQNLGGPDEESAKRRFKEREAKLLSGEKTGIFRESVDLIIAVGVLVLIVWAIKWFF